MRGTTHRTPQESFGSGPGTEGAIVAALAACGLVGVVAVMAMVVHEVTLLMQAQPGPW